MFYIKKLLKKSCIDIYCTANKILNLMKNCLEVMDLLSVPLHGTDYEIASVTLSFCQSVCKHSYGRNFDEILHSDSGPKE